MRVEGDRRKEIHGDVELTTGERILAVIYTVIALAVGLYMDFKYATTIFFTIFVLAGPILGYYLMRERHKTFELQNFAERCINEYMDTSLVRKLRPNDYSFFSYDLKDLYDTIIRDKTRKDRIWKEKREIQDQLTDARIKINELEEDKFKLECKINSLNDKLGRVQK